MDQTIQTNEQAAQDSILRYVQTTLRSQVITTMTSSPNKDEVYQALLEMVQQAGQIVGVGH